MLYDPDFVSQLPKKWPGNSDTHWCTGNSCESGQALDWCMLLSKLLTDKTLVACVYRDGVDRSQERFRSTCLTVQRTASTIFSSVGSVLLRGRSKWSLAPHPDHGSIEGTQCVAVAFFKAVGGLEALYRNYITNLLDHSPSMAGS